VRNQKAPDARASGAFLVLFGGALAVGNCSRLSVKIEGTVYTADCFVKY
jgi:hypothetical protein